MRSGGRRAHPRRPHRGRHGGGDRDADHPEQRRSRRGSHLRARQRGRAPPRHAALPPRRSGCACAGSRPGASSPSTACTTPQRRRSRRRGPRRSRWWPPPLPARRSRVRVSRRRRFPARFASDAARPDAELTRAASHGAAAGLGLRSAARRAPVLLPGLQAPAAPPTRDSHSASLVVRAVGEPERRTRPRRRRPGGRARGPSPSRSRARFEARCADRGSSPRPASRSRSGGSAPSRPVRVVRIDAGGVVILDGVHVVATEAIEAMHAEE